MTGQARKCEHEACRCMVSAEDAYCTPQCEKSADEGKGPPCVCGHKDCNTATVMPSDRRVGM